MRRLVWGGHASRGLVTLVLAVHATCFVWFVSSWHRVRLMTYDFHEVSSEAFMTQPPERLLAFGYTEDDPADLARFRRIAEPVVAGALTDGDKLRRLGDLIYSMRRRGLPEEEREVREGLSVVLDRMEAGEVEGCSQMSVVLAAFWRSLGGHTRGVRWATVNGSLGHFAVELYSDANKRWMYYDMNMNGYGAEDDDDDGLPLSIASLRSNLLTREGLHLNINEILHDWSVAQFEEFLTAYPIEWYTLNNEMLYMERNRRFGALNRLFPWLARLPYPADRIVDNVVGQRDRRLVVDGKIQIAGLLTFSAGRLLVLYLVVMMMCCGVTLLASRKPRSLEKMA